MNLYRTLAFLALALFSLAPRAEVLDINLNHDSVDGRYTTQGAYSEGFHGGITGFFNDDSVHFLSFDVQSEFEAVLNSPYIFAAGLSAFGFRQDVESDDSDDNLAYGLGLSIRAGYRYRLGEVPAQLAGNLFYSPQIINAGEISSLSRVDVRGEFQLTPSVIVYLGHRTGRADYEDKDIKVDDTFDNSTMLGFRFRF